MIKLMRLGPDKFDQRIAPPVIQKRLTTIWTVLEISMQPVVRGTEKSNKRQGCSVNSTVLLMSQKLCKKL